MTRLFDKLSILSILRERFSAVFLEFIGTCLHYHGLVFVGYITSVSTTWTGAHSCRELNAFVLLYIFKH
jgi:hypothetical protein